MSENLNRAFTDAERRLRELVAKSGLTPPDQVLPGIARRELIARWTEPDLIEVVVDGEELMTTAQLPAGLSRAADGTAADMRRLIEERDLPVPDIIRPGRYLGDAEFIWRDEKVIVIVGEDDDPPAEALN